MAHFLNDYVDFSNGVFGVDERVVWNLFRRSLTESVLGDDAKTIHDR